MGKVLDIRGTHGSGKSHIVKTLLEHYDHQPDLSTPLSYVGCVDIIGYYIPALNLHVIGKYVTACGGCDGIKTQAEIKYRVERVQRNWPDRNIVLEGILVAHTFGPWSEYAKGQDWHFLFLDTPLDTCIERVNSRRAGVGKGHLVDPKNIVRDWGRIRSLRDKFDAAGHISKWLDHTAPIEGVLRELTS